MRSLADADTNYLATWTVVGIRPLVFPPLDVGPFHALIDIG
jgi:hypothetical protein